MTKRRRAWLIISALIALAIFYAFSRGGTTKESFDYSRACGTANARAESPDDIRAILVTIENSRVLDDVNPKPNDIQRHTAIVAFLGIQVDAPTYPVPSGFKGRLPQPPDYAKVRELQRQLAAACG